MRLFARSSISLRIVLIVVFVAGLGGRHGFADESPLPVIAGLEETVKFWKAVFTQHGASEMIFHDPLDPMRIYKVLEVGEGRAARRLVDEERGKIVQEFRLEDENRVHAQRGIRERFVSGLKMSGKYLGQMQRIFREAGLPTDLAYLPLVESSFDIRARSRAGALGIWQFMPSTGRKFLRISRALDERRDPMESTRAAAQFLKQNYEIFGTWPLAITAYNHGREGMLRAVAEVGSRDLMEIIRRYQSPSFGFASKSFYAEFLAALEVAKSSDEFFPDLEHQAPSLLEEVEVARPVSISSLLKHTDIGRGTFLEWNPALNPKIRDIPKGYRVKIPPENLEAVLASYERLVNPDGARRKAAPVETEAASWVRHRVVAGETLSQIARSYRTSVHEIQRANRLASTHVIAAGQQLKIPKKR